MKKFRLTITGCLLFAFIFRSLCLNAQTEPPTGGPGPSNDDNKFPTILYPAIGVAALAGGYLLFKKQPAGIPPGEHIRSYLWRHNILPTADAYELIYALNPGLKNRDLIPKNYKLIEPDFPELTNVPEQKAAELPQNGSPELNAQLDLFKRNAENFRNSALSKAADADRINGQLRKIEDILASYPQNREEIGAEKSALITDLLSVINLTLQQAMSRAGGAGSSFATETELIASITNNLAELEQPVRPTVHNTDKRSKLMNRHFFNDIRRFYASMNAINLKEENKDKNAGEKISRKAEKSIEKAFAFAVYKIRPDGTPVIKGPEVEGKYAIQYVCPALKDFPNTFHHIRDFATYAPARLYPAKYYLQVQHITGKAVQLRDPIIDAREEYNRPEPQFHKKMIIIPIYVKE